MKIAAIVLSVFAVSSVLLGQGLSIGGVWTGALEPGPGLKLRLAFHFVKAPDGNWTGTLDSLDQGAMGLKLSRVELRGANLAVQLEAPPAKFDGTVDGENIRGTWHQNGADLPLTLHHGEPEGAARPQEPKPPFPYRAEEVEFPSKSAGVRLAGTLTMPQGGGPFAAALLITGSGAQDRDETIFGHKPFLLLADFLTRRGMAVLRVDDRGTGKSTGSFAAATTADFVEDAAGGVAYLCTRKEIDPKRIGLIGHSEGATVGPLLASRDADIAAVVMMAGAGVPGREILTAQAAAMMRASGLSDEMVAANGKLQNRLFTLADPKLDDAALANLRKTLEEEILKTATGGDAEAARGAVRAQIEGAATPWMRQFVSFDPAPVLRKMSCPVLVLNGALDLQVLPSQNLPAIVAALEAGGNRDYEVLKFAGLNHLFQTAKTGHPLEYAQNPETMAPVVLEAIADWLGRHGFK